MVVKKKPATVTEPLGQAAQPGKNQAQAALLEKYQWAVNPVKLNRAIAAVRVEKKGLVGAEFEAAVKDEYVKYGALLANGDALEAPKKGKVVNMAEDNAGDDDEDEE